MSKTFYADGNSGKVAIMEGDLDLNAVNNPILNTNKLYFHSDLNYLYRVAKFSGNATFDAVPANSWNTREVEMGTIAWNIGSPIIFLGRINGVETNINLLVQSNNNLGDFRFVWFAGLLSGSTLRCLILSRGDGFYAGLPAFSFSYSCSVFSVKQPDFSAPFYASPTSIKMGNGKFDSEKVYIKQGGNFKYATGRTINMNTYGWYVDTTAPFININEGL